MRQHRMGRIAVAAALAAISLPRFVLAQNEPAAGDKAPTQPMEEPAKKGGPPREEDKPITLDKPLTAAPENQDPGGFWFWPSPAPLVGHIVTDRPGFSDSAALIPRGHVQIETAYTYSYDREGKEREIEHIAPDLLFRTGLTDWLEFRLNWEGGSWTERLSEVTTVAGRHVNHEDHEDGGTDMGIGVKVPLMKQEGCKPNISAIFTLGIPTGSESKSANNVVPTLKLPWNYVINEHFTVYGSILGRVQDGSDGQFYQTAATLAGGYKVCDKCTLYLEYYGLYNATRHQDAAHVLSAGPIIELSENISLDMRAGLGLNEQAPDFQASIGLGFRF